jgi:hypothetical protein
MEIICIFFFDASFKQQTKNKRLVFIAMAEVTYYRKNGDGFYDGHVMVGDGMTDMVPSYRVRVGKSSSFPPMYPVSNHPRRPGYNPEIESYYFVPAQEVLAMSLQERENLAKVLYYYDTNINASSAPKDWCLYSDPCLAINNVCCPSKTKRLTPLQIVGILSAVGMFVFVSLRLLKRRRQST